MKEIKNEKHTIKTIFKDMIKEYKEDKKYYNRKLINGIFDFLKSTFKHLARYIAFLIVVVSILSIFIYSLKDKSLVDLEKLKTGIHVFFGIGTLLFSTLNMLFKGMTKYILFDDIYSNENKRKLKNALDIFFAGMIFYVFSEKITFLIFELFKIY